MFTIFVGASLWITKWAAKRTRSAADFYTAGGGITGFQNGLAIAGDFMSAASFLGISAAVMSALPMAGGTHMLLRGFAGAVPRFSINKTKGRGLLLPFLNPSRQYPLWVTAVPQRGGFFIFAAPFRAGS